MGGVSVKQGRSANMFWTSLLLSFTIISTAKADTCSDCTAVVNHLEEFLVSAPGIDLQTTILVAGLCPQADDPEACPEALPPFWKMIADLLWPGYYDPKADWMCGPTCAAPEDVSMSCDQCVSGIKASIDQLVAVPTLDAIVDAPANGDFCAEVGEGCPEVVDWVIRLGLPLLAASGGDDAAFQEVANLSFKLTLPSNFIIYL